MPPIDCAGSDAGCARIDRRDRQVALWYAAVKAQAPDMDWQSMIEFGNRLRHAYRATDADKVWLVIQDH